MKTKILAALAVAFALVGLASPAFATDGAPPADNTNEVTYWCAPNIGYKYDPVSTPFVVPAPPAGYEWYLLVLKAGSTGHGGVINENETFANPVVGQSYTHSSGKDLSHAILCKRAVEVTTTVATTVPETTTIATTVPETTTTTTATTLPTTTTVATTVPQTTTTAATTTVPVTTVPQTTTPQETTTTAAPTTTVALQELPVPMPPVEETVAPVPPTTMTKLPVTGAMTVREIAFGLALLFGGLALVLYSKAVRRA